MNNAPSYKEQFDKLTRAYIENRVNPFLDCACFVGNLLNGRGEWALERSWNECGRIEDNLSSTHFRRKYNIDSILKLECSKLYSIDEILKLERIFLKTFIDGGGKRVDRFGFIGEDALFIAFEKSLDLLKQIHISKGEIIDEVPVFKQRQLA